MPERTCNVLFLCTGNTARSILAEGILHKDGGGRFSAYSAGSQPKGVVNALARKVLESYGYPTADYRSKSWKEFAWPSAPQMDFIFSVCDSAAVEACPIWPGHPASAHWGSAGDRGSRDREFVPLGEVDRGEAAMMTSRAARRQARTRDCRRGAR
jgi:arsenate reductase (thioredoxin)